MAAPEDPALPQDLAGLPQDIVFVDLETTGANAAYHRITEIGIVRIENGAVVEEWSSLVNPGCDIPSYIQEFTGITNEMVAAAPRFSDLAALVLEKLGPSSNRATPIFAAHNARFDYAFLRAEFRRVEVNFSARVLCTVKLSRRLFPEHPRHNLDAVMERNGLSCSARHRALGDARVIGEFWLKLCRDLPEAKLAGTARSMLSAQQLPAHLPAGLADELPEGPGVYCLYGADDVPLYVRKSASVRLGILGHFSDDRVGTRERKLKEAVRRIEWVETAGELGASLREAEHIRKLRPIHNRRLDPEVRSFTIRIAEDSGRVEIALIGALNAAELGSCFGVFHSGNDANRALRDIARAKQLCLKLLGLEDGAGSCLAYQMGKCKGGCVGKEPLILHALRTQMALSALKLKAWPFPGRAALRERGSMSAADLHVVDHWAYLGTAHCEDELAELAQRKPAAAFDPHIYRILVRYFANHPKLDWHDLSERAHPLSAGS
jgi:DNA polymerase III subunit epsilon